MKSTPYWWDLAPPPHLPRLPLPELADVGIVGAGYAGLSAALTLARRGRSVVVFDSGRPGEGASTRNGGITSGNIRPTQTSLERRFGKARAEAMAAEGHLARAFLYRFLSDEGIDCDFAPVGRFLGAVGPLDYDRLARAADALYRTTGVESFAVPKVEQRAYLGTDFYHGGAVRKDIGILNPAKFLTGLLKAAQAAGVVVQAETTVESIGGEPGSFTLTTSEGPFHADRIMVCTNGYTDGADPWLRRRMVPVRSRIIATEELTAGLMTEISPRLMSGGDTRELGPYFRPSPDGSRLLFGGRDGSTSGDPAASTAELRTHLVTLFPQLRDVALTHSWFGNVAMHRDMVPRLFARDGIVYATGFCGSGVVWAPWLASRAALRLVGEDRFRSAFDFAPPAAIPFYRGRPWFMPLAMTYFRLKDRQTMRREARAR